MELPFWIIEDEVDRLCAVLGFQSVYQMFCVLGENWGVEVIDQDFKEYLLYGELPFYVKAELWKNNIIPLS